MGLFIDDKKIIRGNEDKDVAYLCTADDSVSADLLRSLLSDAGIPSMIKDRTFGGTLRVLSGFTGCGCDLFVGREKLDEARELVEAYASATTGTAKDPAPTEEK
ncbi:MAG: DUF2007 domain-containing protein [Clostridia bacterium]|nr:DUF2007 domain-containing protein [Clostridia bacterium]